MGNRDRERKAHAMISAIAADTTPCKSLVPPRLSGFIVLLSIIDIIAYYVYANQSRETAT